MNKFQKSLDRIKSNVPLHEDSWTDEDKEHIITIMQALEKQIPKKPKGDYHSVPHYRCPSCNSAVKVFEDAHEYHWCLYCGQALDWSDIK